MPNYPFAAVLAFEVWCVSQDLLEANCKISCSLNRTGHKVEDFMCLTYRIGGVPVSQAMQLEPLIEIVLLKLIEIHEKPEKNLLSSIKLKASAIWRLIG